MALFLGCLSGCRGGPLEGLQQTPKKVSTSFFEHLMLEKQVAKGSADPLVVVIEGDGRPWRSSRSVALDPTPEHPLLLEWFRRWQGDAVYLGRPCYFGSRQISPPDPEISVSVRLRTSSCDPYWYTFGRYSPAVVSSMEQVLSERAAGRPLLLLGHSGGGTLAMLIAARMPEVVAVVTLSGNLRVSEWVRFHQYTPLHGSLDPALEETLRPAVQQTHIAASGDQVILADWIRDEATRQGGDYELWKLKGHQDYRDHWKRLDHLIGKLLRNAQD